MGRLISKNTPVELSLLKFLRKEKGYCLTYGMIRAYFKEAKNQKGENIFSEEYKIDNKRIIQLEKKLNDNYKFDLKNVLFEDEIEKSWFLPLEFISIPRYLITENLYCKACMSREEDETGRDLIKDGGYRKFILKKSSKKVRCGFYCSHVCKQHEKNSSRKSPHLVFYCSSCEQNVGVFINSFHTFLNYRDLKEPIYVDLQRHRTPQYGFNIEHGILLFTITKTIFNEFSDKFQKLLQRRKYTKELMFDDYTYYFKIPESEYQDIIVPTIKADKCDMTFMENYLVLTFFPKSKYAIQLKKKHHNEQRACLFYQGVKKYKINNQMRFKWNAYPFKLTPLLGRKMEIIK